MIWNWNESNDVTYPESIIKIQDLKSVNAKHFKYESVIKNVV